MKRHMILALVLVACTSGWFAAAPPEDSPQPVAPPRPEPAAPAPPEVLDAALRRGISFLIKDQNRDGSWGSPERTKNLNIYAPVPGAHHAFRVAVTALCVAALIEVNDHSDEVRRAIERGEDWLFAEVPNVRRANADTLYNIWSHAYAIQALVRMHWRVPNDTERHGRIADLIRNQFEYLQRYESVDGGWGYYDFRAGTKRPATDSTSFQSAAVLVAFREAKDLGIAPPAKMVKSAVDSIHRQRKPDFTYLYGEYMKYEPMHPINRPGGSLGRSQACNIALRLWDDAKITDEVLTGWLDRLFARNLWLDMGRKRPVPHESHFAVAGYFFYFGHYYASRCIEQVKPEKKAFYQDHLAQVLLKLQEKDGSWWDFPLYNYHQQYGTAFALMSLKRCYKSGETVPKKSG